jgi:hypothetical protein
MRCSLFRISGPKKGPIGQNSASLCLTGKLFRYVFRQVAQDGRLPPPEYTKTNNLIEKMEISQILSPKTKIPSKRIYILKILG